jgi:hypothetical protein
VTQSGKLDPTEPELPPIDLGGDHSLDDAVRLLIAQGERLTIAVERKARAQKWRNYIGLLLVCALAAVSVDTRHEVHQLGQTFCPTVELLIPQPGDPAPTAGRPQIVAQRAVDLSRQLGC